MLKRFLLILMLSMPFQARAAVVWDLTNLPFNIGSMIESGVSSASDAMREVSDAARLASGKVREAYQLVVKTQAVQTTINTYKSFLEAAKIYHKTLRLIDIVTGNPGFSSILRVAGDHDVRELMGRDWSDTVDIMQGAHGTILGTDRRITRAMNAFDRGNVPYSPDLVYIDPKFFREKERYQERFYRNKTYAVIAQANLDRAEENVRKIERMESRNDGTDTTAERDTLRNAIQIQQYQAQIETNNELARMNKMLNEQMLEETQKRATDVVIASNEFEAF